jgi:hypothetical protein
VWQRSDRFAGSDRFTFAGSDRITGSDRRRAGAKIPPGFFHSDGPAMNPAVRKPVCGADTNLSPRTIPDEQAINKHLQPG